jgi:hypothetical protein
MDTKRCRKCGNVKTLPFFPCDRSRPDGHWHTCRNCNRQSWATQGKQRTADRKAEAQAGRQSVQGLPGLRKYQHRHVADLFTSLPPELRHKARLLLDRSLSRHRWHLTQSLRAALIANAASNAPRVGDNSWARSMLRKKGYRRAVRRAAEQQAQLAEIRARYAGQPRIWVGNLDGI